jgi:hypothetical protein
MSFSVKELLDRLPDLPLLATFKAGPLLVQLYEEDARQLPAMVRIPEGADPREAGGGLQGVLSLIWLDATAKKPAELLYRTQGWCSPPRPGFTYYEAALLELQLMLQVEKEIPLDESHADYTVAGLLYLDSRMGRELADHVRVLELRPGGGGDLFTRLN